MTQHSESSKLPPDVLPPEFLNRLKQIVPESAWSDCCQGFAPRPQFTARVNRLHATPTQLREELQACQIEADTVSWHAHALRFAALHRPSLVRSAAVAEGRLYVQNLSSMLAAQILDPQPGEQVLDLAAAPGGKASDLAERMGNQGWLSAVEPIRSRYFKLRDTFQRLGITIAHTYMMDGRRVGKKVPDRFDRVLLDAPCSGEARIRSAEPESFQFWSGRKIKEQARKQRGLLESAVAAARPGARILYCTCSFAPEENEAIVSDYLTRFPDQVDVVPFDLPIDNWQPGLSCWERAQFAAPVTQARRILPAEDMDAMFLCLLEKLPVRRWRR